MYFVCTIIVICFALLLILLNGSTFKIALRLVTGNNYSDKELFFTSFLLSINLVLLVLFILGIFFINFDENLCYLFMNVLFRAYNAINILEKVLLPIILLNLAFIFINSLIVLTLNINWSWLRYLFNILKNHLAKLLKKKEKVYELAECNESHDITSVESAVNTSNVNTSNCVNIMQSTEITKIHYNDLANNPNCSEVVALIKNEQRAKIKFVDALITSIFVSTVALFIFAILLIFGYLLSYDIISF